MSQAKVDRYKEEKANRKKNMKKEKIKRAVSAVCASAVCVVVIGWIGYSAYGFFRNQDKDSAPVQTEVDLTALTDYLSGLQTADAAAE